MFDPSGGIENCRGIGARIQVLECSPATLTREAEIEAKLWACQIDLPVPQIQECLIQYLDLFRMDPSLIRRRSEPYSNRMFLVFARLIE